MKRVFVCTVLLFGALSLSAQMVSSSSLIVTETREKLPEVQAGYQQSIDLSYNYAFSNSEGGGLELNYIGGYRFNRMFYAGVGTGLYFDFDQDYTHLFNVPLYIHGRVYFTKKRYMPFVGLSIGGLFSTPRKDTFAEIGYEPMEYSYSTCRFLLNPMVGFDYRINAKMEVYASVGFRGMTNPYCWVFNGVIIKRQAFHCGLDIHIGLSF